MAIATAGRPTKLERTLRALASLAPASPPFEVIVVLDGDDPPSRALLAKEHPFPLRVVVQPKAGAGPARNRAAHEARSDLLLLLNDDTRPEAGCLLAHLHSQERHGPSLVAGTIVWDPEHEITPFMEWLAPAGHQFNFARLQPGTRMPWGSVWATNLAVPRAWMLDEPFDPLFPNMGLEDGEWAFRQYRRGRWAVYVPEAVVYHWHHFAVPADYRRRAQEFGSAARYVVRRHPELGWRFLVRPTAAAAARLLSLALPPYWRRETLWDLDFRISYVFSLMRPRPSLGSQPAAAASGNEQG